MDETERTPHGTDKATRRPEDGTEHRKQPSEPAGAGRVVPAWRDPSRLSGLVVGRLLSGAGSWAAGELWHLVTEQLPGDRD
ncbi:hypothetical protein [Streptomyces sp. NRRL B-24484]|uniref:hypothetical protein n=1 Tax=Streptomyces sp. NRRL B-24484 TaxID=1463833 RepID=UPI0004C18571|nr:hypothetical protein [Streptomyces sp. NRRL B-24484]